VALSLKERAYVFNTKFQRKITPKDVRKVYKGRKVTMQKMKRYPGKLNPIPLTYEEQIIQLHELNYQVQEAITNGFEIIFVDESTFNPKKLDHQVWAPSGQPFPINDKWAKGQYVACMAGISCESGLVHQMYKYQAFTSNDVGEFLIRLRQKCGSKKIAVFWDNASIHTAKFTQAVATSDDVLIPLIRNIAYRPDLNPAEWLWKNAKIEFRRIMMYFKAQPESYMLDIMATVENSVESATHEKIKSWVLVGHTNIRKCRTTYDMLPGWREMYPGTSVPVLMINDMAEESEESQEVEQNISDFQGSSGSDLSEDAPLEHLDVLNQ
jgi:hypothetical protein